MTCNEHIVSEDLMNCDTPLNVAKCKLCRKIYDKRRIERIKRLDSNLKRLETYNTSIATMENLLVLYKHHGITSDNLFEFIHVREGLTFIIY